MSAPTPVLAAAARARRQATVVAAIGAAVPTVLAAQGMASLAVDVLGFNLLAAVALASFLELALVSSALLARAAALAGRPGGADAVAVWVVSATSGVLAGVHELVATAPDGSSTWSTDPGAFLAAAVRAVAPLVAAWLWERVLQAARAEHAQRTLTEVRRDRRLLEVARAALAVRRLGAGDGGRWTTRRVHRARRRLDRAHLAALRVAPPAPSLDAVLAAVGQVDHLAAATLVPGPASPARVETSTVAAPDAVPALADRRVVAAAAERAPVVTAQVRPHDHVPDAAATLFDVPGQDVPASDGATSNLDVALDLLRQDPEVSGARLAEELARRGRPVSARTGRRLRACALELLAPASVP
ncbi:hypothetical protein AB6N24_09920 [Cellulomonas sp. 179-A 4D5 NHS]|uniref:hypothetical protein n=1 Tax=Cellulomonas sp. 179-A 4D5 NHS TaxID=3142378 RepID=UPI0039A0DCD6